MNKKEFSNIMSAMHSAYPNEQVTSDKMSISLWFEMLKDVDYKTASANLAKHIKTNKFAPTIAEIRGPEKTKTNNFVGRNYDMKSLELALLGIKPATFEEISEEGCEK